MADDITKEQFDDIGFLQETGIDREKWDSLKEHQVTLYRIYKDFIENNDQFIEIAVSLSRLIQKMPGVHSVRWRIKDPGHLVKKIIRKKMSGSDKYNLISEHNYRDIVSDLIGIRALHLFKGDFPDLHKSIIETWNLDEEPAAYVRKGDTEELRELYRDLGLKVEEHRDGYRSIHYIIETNFTKRAVKCELQVRTIFEEGWSEIDHRIRYPDFSDDPLIRDFLHIFNRLSGAADEMGTFVDRLSTELAVMNREQEEAKSKALEIETQLNEKLQKLEDLTTTNTSLGSEVRELKRLLAKRQSELNKSITDITIKAKDIAALNSLWAGKVVERTDTLRSLNISPSAFKEAVSASEIIKRNLGGGIADTSKLKKKEKD